MVPANKSVEKLAETAAVYLGRSPTEKGVDRLMADLSAGEWKTGKPESMAYGTPAFSVPVYDDSAPSGSKLPAQVYGQTESEAVARGNLIAAAPQLLAACERALEDLGHYLAMEGRGASPTTHVIRAALAKAGGAK